MLGKLLKYEIPAVGRQLAPMYLAWLAASILLGITIGRFDNSSFFIVIPVLVYFGVTVAVFVMAVVLIIQRYYNSLFGDEAYFNQVLPVSAGAHILSKTLTALVWTVLTSLAAILSGLIIALLAGSMAGVWAGEPISVSWADMWNAFSTDFKFAQAILIMIEFLVACIFSVVKSILAVYAAITIGQIFRKHVVLASIVAYIGLLVFESTVGNIFITILGLSGQQAELESFVSGATGMQIMFGVAILASLALSTVYFFICRYFMENKLNLA